MSQEIPSSGKKEGVEKVPRYFMPFSKARVQVYVKALPSQPFAVIESIMYRELIDPFSHRGHHWTNRGVATITLIMDVLLLCTDRADP